MTGQEMTFSGFVVNGVFTGYGGKKVLGWNVISLNLNPEKISVPGKSTLLYPPTFTAPVISFIQPIQVQALFSSLLGLDLLR